MTRRLTKEEVFPSMFKDLPSTDISAGALSGEHLDRIVRFKWRFPTSQVIAIVTGVVREIHHDGAGRVYVHLIPTDADDLDTGYEKEEFSIMSDATIGVLA